MSTFPQNPPGLRNGHGAQMIRRIGWLIAAVWTLMLGGLFLWSYFHELDAARKSAAVTQGLSPISSATH